MVWNCMIPSLMFSSFLFVVPSRSRLVNVTVDDTYGDPSTGSFPEYSPNNGTWNAGSSAEDCPSCYIGPSILDLTKIHNETWHDTTYLPWETPATITVRFTGSAVYVFNILPNTLPQTITLANISFFIDGQDAGRFLHSPDAGTTILYDQLVYNNTELNDGPHTLTMTAGSNSLVLFDYLVYTTQGNDTKSTGATSGSSARSSNTPVGTIVGGVIGSVLLLSGVAIVAFLLYKRRAHHGSNRDDDDGGSERPQHLVRVREDNASSNSSPPASPASPSVYPESSMRSLDGPMAQGHTIIPRRTFGNVSGPDTRPSPFVADSPSSPTADWSSKRRAELTRTLEAMQLTRSALSSQSLNPSSRSESDLASITGEGGGTEAAIRELEAEMVRLRGVLSGLNARLADQDGGRHLEPLPEYVE